MGKIDFAKIEAIRPTFFFKSSSRGIVQLAEIVILNPREETNASVLIKFNGQKTQRMIFGVKNGSHAYPFDMPEVEDQTEITFDLSLEGKLQDATTMKWPSVRRWEIHLVQHTQHSLNFTSLTEDTLRDYHKFYNKLIDHCEATRNQSAATQFHYTIETAWPLIHFIRNSSRNRVEKLLKLIREGRIEVSALFGNQISEISSSEELIRLLYPVFRLKRVYDIPVDTAMLNQVSGLSWGLASVLADAGIEFFVPTLPGFNLPTEHPGAFYWEAISGQKILCWQPDRGSGQALTDDLSNLEVHLKHLESINYPYSAVRHAISGSMRQNAQSMRNLSQAVEAWNKTWAFPQLIFSTNKKFYQKIKREMPAEIPAFRGELPGAEQLAGVTSNARDLATARLTQAELVTAEKFAAILSVFAETPFPMAEITSAYEKLLRFNEPTWGSSQPFGPAHQAVVAEKKALAHSAASHAKSILARSLNKLADQIELIDDSYYLVVFNPTDRSRTDVVTSELIQESPTGLPSCPEQDAKTGPLPVELKCTPVFDRDLVHLPEELVTKGFTIVDLSNGETVPYQIDDIKDPGDAVADAADRFALGQVNSLYLKKLTLIASGVPALGYKVYQIKSGSKTESTPKRAEVSVKTLENRFYRIIVATNTGGIFSIYDKELQQELVDGFAQHRLNQLFVKSVGRDNVHKLENVNIRREQRGSISMSLIISGSTQGCPQCIQEITIYNHVKRIDFTNRILKDATPLQEVYLAFPFTVKNPQIAYEGGLTVQQPIQDQLPGSRTDIHAVQNWVSFSDGETGIAWSSLDAPIVRFGDAWPTSLSSEYQLVTPRKAVKLPKDKLPNAHLYSLLVTGNYKTGFSNVQVTDMLFRYSITSFKGTENDGQAQAFGQSQTHPLSPVFIKGPQSGLLKNRDSFLELDAENVVVQTLKKSETDNRLVVRLRETRGETTDCELKLNWKAIHSASLANILEETQRPLENTDHEIKLKVNAWEVVTVQIKFQE